MEKVIKQCVGIDCSQDELVVCYSVMDSNYDSRVVSNAKFINSDSGFNKLLQWKEKLKGGDFPFYFVFEATGVYHEKISLCLHKNNCWISVILPNKAKAFSKTVSM